MHFAIHFPIADGRRLFEQSRSRVLPKPNWLDPDSAGDFVRLFGPIRERSTQGIIHWAGESAFAESRRGLRIKPGATPQPRLAYRRLFADGLSVAHFDVGLTYRRQHRWGFDAEGLIEVVMNTIAWVQTPDSSGSAEGPGWQTVDVSLHRAGDLIANAYSVATTRRPGDPAPEVAGGRPVVVIECTWPEDLIGMGVSNQELRPGVWHIRQPIAGTPEPLFVWALDRDELSSHDLRQLRIHFSRIHIARETLRHVLRWLGENSGRTPTEYVRPVIERAERLLRRESLNGFPVSATLEAAYESDLLVSPVGYGNMSLQLELIDASLARQIDKLLKRSVVNADKVYSFEITNSRLGDLGVTTLDTGQSGDRQMGDEVRINVEGSTTGDIIGLIKDSRNVLNKTSTLDPKLQAALGRLLDTLDETQAELPDDARTSIAADVEAITEEAAKENPRPNVLKAFLDGIRQTAETVGKVALPIASAVQAVLKLIG